MAFNINEEVAIPEGVQVSYENGRMRVQGEKGSVERTLRHPRVTVRVDGGKVVLTTEEGTQREKRHLYTLLSHVKNMVRGAKEGHSYKLKICSGHFPMNVSVANGVLTVKNFLGEAVPRTLKLKEGAQVKVNGDVIEVEAADKELAGSQASDIEQLTRITNRDRRIFQDGLFMIEKDGEEIV